MLKALLKLILRSEFKELEDKKDSMDATIAEANKTVSNMKSAYGNCLELYCKRLESHEADLKKLQKQIELQKIYCYLIPRLLDSSGLELSDDFDITKYEDASKLLERFMTGDLKNF